MSERDAATLLRRVRLVPLRSPAVSDEPVDVRIAGGVVVEVAASLSSAPGELVIEADGRHATPGLWDQHVHMTQFAQSRRRLDLRDVTSAQDALRIVAGHVATLPAGDVSTVLGFGHRSAGWSRPATVAELDAVSGGRPVVLISGDVHNGWVNSHALRVLGLSGVTGPLEENDWFGAFERLAELPGAEGDPEADLRRAVAEAPSRGVVGVVDFEFGQGFLDWPARIERGVDQLRVRTATYADRLDDVIAAGLRTGDDLPGSTGLAQMGPLKIIADGSLSTRTAFCCAPYLDDSGTESPRGHMNITGDALAALLLRARQHGLEAAVHAIGDATAAEALGAFETTEATGSIEHAQLLSAPDIARMGRLGVRASVQPSHLYDDRDVIERSWPDRADRCFPLRALLDAGVEARLGSDAPVAPLDPWLSMAAAVHRSGDDRPAWHPEQAISAREALVASTDGQDTIVVGSRGDVVLLDGDPLREVGDSAAAARQLRTVAIAATVVAGRATHLAI
jgi:predicted amidohydrolase YtcJ